jgi:Lon protease-like protein
MPELGLFPLGMVLLPTEQVPLHIFEPRYRELIAECLEDESEFGLVLEDEDGLREIGTRAAVVDVLHRHDDGRLDIAVEGRERFRIVRETTGRSFRTADVEPLADLPDASDPETTTRLLGLMTRVAELAGSEVEPPDVSTFALSYAIAARFELATAVKLELLSESSERVRCERLAELLEDAAVTLERRLRISASAQGNGKVHVTPDDA